MYTRVSLSRIVGLLLCANCINLPLAFGEPSGEADALASNAKPREVDAAEPAVLPMKKILEEARKKRQSRAESLARDAGIRKFSPAHPLAEAAPPAKIRVYEANDLGDLESKNPLAPPPRDPRSQLPRDNKRLSPRETAEAAQKEVDENDGEDVTHFDEMGYPLSPEHLQSFALCKGSRLEQGICNRNVYWMSVLASIAYLKYPLATPLLKQSGFSKVTFIEGPSDVEVFVVKRAPLKDAQGNTLWETGLSVVGIRGSDDAQDWLTNLRTTTSSINGHDGEAWLHEGFAEALDEVYPNILAALDLANDRSPVFITGHSLGGAIGMQLAIRLVARESLDAPALIPDGDDRLRGIYTWAIPRVGNARARNILDRYLNRNKNIALAFINDSDPVTKVPFDWWGFKRFGLQITLPQKATGADFGNRRLWKCYGDIDYKGPSAFSWDFIDADVDAHRFRSYLRHIVSFREDGSLQNPCIDADAVYGGRYSHQLNFTPLRLPVQPDGHACNYTAYSWGGNLE